MDTEQSAASKAKIDSVCLRIVIMAGSGLDEEVKLSKPQGNIGSFFPFFKASHRKGKRNP